MRAKGIGKERGCERRKVVLPKENHDNENERHTKVSWISGLLRHNPEYILFTVPYLRSSFKISEVMILQQEGGVVGEKEG